MAKLNVAMAIEDRGDRVSYALVRFWLVPAAVWGLYTWYLGAVILPTSSFAIFLILLLLCTYTEFIAIRWPRSCGLDPGAFTYSLLNRSFLILVA